MGRIDQMEGKVEGNQHTQLRGLSLLGLPNRIPSPQFPWPTVNVKALIYDHPRELKQKFYRHSPAEDTCVGGNNVCNYFWVTSIHNSVPAQGQG